MPCILPGRIVFCGGDHSKKVIVLNIAAAGVHSSVACKVQGNLCKAEFRLNPEVEMIYNRSNCPPRVDCCSKHSGSSLGCLLCGGAAEWKFAGAPEASETVMVTWKQCIGLTSILNPFCFGGSGLGWPWKEGPRGFWGPQGWKPTSIHRTHVFAAVTEVIDLDIKFGYEFSLDHVGSASGGILAGPD